MHWNIFVCGDTHWFSLYEKDAKKLDPNYWKESQSLTKDDVLIQLGDFWYVWNTLGTNPKQEETLDKLASLNYTIAVVPWNHENYNEIFWLPEIEKWWNKVWELKRKTWSIYFLKRWEIYQINWKTIFAIWWALSIDKAWRTEEKDWWMLEYLTKQEINKVLENTEKYKNKWVDYILTHTCPMSIARKIVSDTYSAKLRDEVSDLLQVVYDSWMKFKQWHFWHFHKDITIHDDNNEAKFFCHYNNEPVELK